MLKIVTIKLLLAVSITTTILAACGDEDELATATLAGSGVEPTVTSTLAADELVLDGTSWLLAAMNDADVDLQDPITIAFDDGHASGYSGCNDYGDSYTASEDGVFAMPEIEQTEMACEFGTDVEDVFLATLRSVVAFEILDNTRLELRDSAGNTALMFTGDTQEALSDTSWTVKEVDGTPLVEGTEIRFELHNGKISGATGCNSFGGAYHANSTGEVSFSEIFATEQACTEPAGIMEQERAFLDALLAVASYQQESGSQELRLIDPKGSVRIVASYVDQIAGSGSLNRTAWVLDIFRGVSYGGPPITVRFDDRQFAGTIGCVGYLGFIEAQEDGEIASMSTPDSMRPCSEPSDQSEIGDDYLSALGTARQYRATATTLELLDASGEQLMIFRPASGDQRIDSTAWWLVSLNGADLVPGTVISLAFFGGHAVGNGGCNSYGSPYIVSSPGNISIPSAVRTTAGCLEPQGVEEQEEEFFNQLTRVRAYQVGDDILELLDNQGSILLQFEQRPSS